MWQYYITTISTLYRLTIPTLICAATHYTEDARLQQNGRKKH